MRIPISSCKNDVTGVFLLIIQTFGVCRLVSTFCFVRQSPSSLPSLSPAHFPARFNLAYLSTMKLFETELAEQILE